MERVSTDKLSEYIELFREAGITKEDLEDGKLVIAHMKNVPMVIQLYPNRVPKSPNVLEPSFVMLVPPGYLDSGEHLWTEEEWLKIKEALPKKLEERPE